MAKNNTDKNPIHIGLFLFLSAVVIYIFISHLIHNFPYTVEKKNVVICSQVGKAYEIKISKDGFSPSSQEAKVCDQVIFINVDQNYHQIAFGKHERHLNYPNFKEKLLAPNQTNTFVLAAYGSYQIHDHLNENIKGLIVIF